MWYNVFMKKEEDKYTIFDNLIYVVIVGSIMYFVFLSDFSPFQYKGYSQVDIITKEDIANANKK